MIMKNIAFLFLLSFCLFSAEPTDEQKQQTKVHNELNEQIKLYSLALDAARYKAAQIEYISAYRDYIIQYLLPNNAADKKRISEEILNIPKEFEFSAEYAKEFDRVGKIAKEIGITQ